jgi:Gpi18-like mannosyltransferase
LADGQAVVTPGAGQGRWIALFAAAWLLSAAISLKLIVLPGYAGDVSHYKYWTRVIVTEGMHNIYHGEYPETYAIYPPVTLYAYGLVGKVYDRLTDGNPWATDRMLTSESLSTAIKGVSVAFHLALGIVIFGLLWLLYGVRAGALGSTAYLLNPAVIFDVAYWGAPDAAHTMFAVAALGMTLLGWWQGSWVAAGLSAMTKPQAWALVPLYLIVQFRRTGLVRLVLGGLIAGVVMIAVLAPFIIHGRITDFLTLPAQIAGVMPVASANAHNLWWIVTNNPDPVVLDSERVLGPLTYRMAALPLVLGVAGVTLWRLISAPSTSIFLLSAYQAFGWFCFTTQAHENHSFFVLPLLVMAAPISIAARVLLALISCTLLANMVLHDPAIIAETSDVLSAGPRHSLQIMDSWLNLLILAGWTAVLFVAPKWCGFDSSKVANRRPATPTTLVA